jgi:hypothetical protein
VRGERIPFRAILTTPQAGRGLYEIVEPRLNRLLLFEDAYPTVKRIERTRLGGRIVLHGHTAEGAPNVEAKPLQSPSLRISCYLSSGMRGRGSNQSLPGSAASAPAFDPAGTVADCAMMLDRVLHPKPGHTNWEVLRARRVDRCAPWLFRPRLARGSSRGLLHSAASQEGVA